MIDYRIRPKEGFNGKIGELVSILEHTREVTLAELENLSQFDLDYLSDDHFNSIGSLLLHIASTEFVHQIISFENRDLSESESLTWGTALALGNKARNGIKEKPLYFYLEELSKVRKNTLIHLKSKSEEWLYVESEWDNDIQTNE